VARPATKTQRSAHDSPRRRGLLGRLLKGLVLLALACLVITALPVLMLRWLHPTTSAFMLEARAAAWSAGVRDYRTEFKWASLEQISPHVAIAVIAAEDQQFPFHAGFDFNSIREAVRASEHGRRLRGASTISQQVAKNLFLWNGHSFVRKGLEAWFTVLIEVLWPKERILEMYLNIAQFGDRIYGVQAAAQHFWHKSARSLNSRDAALLAAVLPNPHLLRVDRPSRYVNERREWILGQMRELGGAQYLHAIEHERRNSH
jgi:monofunctional biosynthetic peptidoglycan transglycosylase